jgi:hypothetical protein
VYVDGSFQPGDFRFVDDQRIAVWVRGHALAKDDGRARPHRTAPRLEPEHRALEEAAPGNPEQPPCARQSALAGLEVHRAVLGESLVPDLEAARLGRGGSGGHPLAVAPGRR